MSASVSGAIRKSIFLIPSEVARARPTFVEELSGAAMVPTSLHMISRSLQFFSIALLLGVTPCVKAGELKTGGMVSLNFEDVDGNALSTTDGHVTIITVVTRENEDKAHAIADQVPDRCIGDRKYRYITLVNFQGKLPSMLEGVTRGVIRGRLDAEAKQLKPKYEVKEIGRDPRSDLYVIADFDGKAVTQLGLSPESDDVAVFVFDGEGKLVHHWAEVPPDDSLGKAIAAAAE